MSKLHKHIRKIIADTLLVLLLTPMFSSAFHFIFVEHHWHIHLNHNTSFSKPEKHCYYLDFEFYQFIRKKIFFQLKPACNITVIKYRIETCLLFLLIIFFYRRGPPVLELFTPVKLKEYLTKNQEYKTDHI